MFELCTQFFHLAEISHQWYESEICNVFTICSSFTINVLFSFKNKFQESYNRVHVVLLILMAIVSALIGVYKRLDQLFDLVSIATVATHFQNILKTVQIKNLLTSTHLFFPT